MRSTRPLAILSLASIFCCPLLVGCCCLPAPSLECASVCSSASCRDQVHIIFIDSPVDLAHIGRIPAIAQHFEQIGFTNTEYFTIYEDGLGKQLANRVHQIRAAQPQSRVMLVGWSAGALVMQSALRKLANEGTSVDSVVYLDSWMVQPFVQDGGPKNVGKNILLYRWTNSPPPIWNADVHRLNEPFHLAVPTRPYTYNVILREANRLSGS